MKNNCKKTEKKKKNDASYQPALYLAYPALHALCCKMTKSRCFIHHQIKMCLGEALHISWHFSSSPPPPCPWQSGSSTAPQQADPSTSSSASSSTSTTTTTKAEQKKLLSKDSILSLYASSSVGSQPQSQQQPAPGQGNTLIHTHAASLSTLCHPYRISWAQSSHTSPT